MNETILHSEWSLATHKSIFLALTDMSIYGHCPAHDDFFLVVCSHCGQVVKPQAFEKHCERHHGLFSELYDTSSNCSPDRPQQGRPPSQHGSLCEVQDSRHQGAGPPRVPPPHSPHQGHYKPQHEGTRWGGVKCSLTWSYASTVYSSVISFKCYFPVFSRWIKFPEKPLHHLYIYPRHQKKQPHQSRNQSRKVWTHTLTRTDQEHTAEPTRKSLVSLWCNS